MRSYFVILYHVFKGSILTKRKGNTQKSIISSENFWRKVWISLEPNRSIHKEPYRESVRISHEGFRSLM